MSSEYLGKVNNIITSTDIRNLVGLSTTGILVFNDDITWLKFKYNNKILFISNRCVLYGITWNQMDNVGITTGKAININGTEYLCRSISATDNGTWNGQPIAGEWKDLIMKYTPNVSDSYWNEYYTICRDEGQNSSHATIVGKSSIDTIMQISKTESHSTYAWRPVLEINPYCNISISDENLGELFNPFSPKNYIVNGSSHTLTEKLDRVVIRTLENQLDGAKYTLDLSSQWDSISYGKHTIEIIATDSNGLSSSVILTFSKVKETVATIPIVSNLKQVIEHSKEIKKEIEYQSLKLKNNLIEKGVECSDTDKMSSLIDKIGDIKTRSIQAKRKGYLLEGGFLSNDSQLSHSSLGILNYENYVIYSTGFYNSDGELRSRYTYFQNINTGEFKQGTHIPIVTNCKQLKTKDKDYVIVASTDGLYKLNIDTSAYSIVSTRISPTFIGHSYTTSFVSVGGNIYKIRRENTTLKIKLFNEGSNSYTTLSSTAINGNSKCITSCASDDKIYIISSIATNSYQIFVFDTNTFEIVELPIKIGNTCHVLNQDNKNIAFVDTNGDIKIFSTNSNYTFKLAENTLYGDNGHYVGFFSHDLQSNNIYAMRGDIPYSVDCIVL